MARLQLFMWIMKVLKKAPYEVLLTHMLFEVLGILHKNNLFKQKK